MDYISFIYRMLLNEISNCQCSFGSWNDRITSLRLCKLSIWLFSKYIHIHKIIVVDLEFLFLIWADGLLHRPFSLTVDWKKMWIKLDVFILNRFLLWWFCCCGHFYVKCLCVCVAFIGCEKYGTSVFLSNLIAYYWHPFECKIEYMVCIRLLYSFALVSPFDH